LLYYVTTVTYPTAVYTKTGCDAGSYRFAVIPLNLFGPEINDIGPLYYSSSMTVSNDYLVNSLILNSTG